MGLISDQPYEYVTAITRRMIQKAHDMGVHKDMDPFITLSFMALTVIPEIRLTPRGIYNVTEQRFLYHMEPALLARQCGLEQLVKWQF